MNSALQALSHAMPLTRHFLSSRYVQDLNHSNPLGTGGKLAIAYGEVLRDLWMKPVTSISPTALKRVIALFAPRFAGYLQHDAQEFLAYLLDGLHEDLNRIQNAPYVELPDVDENENMAVAGARAWEAHLSRNDSLVLDTFYGLFRSTCVCPHCERVSVSFDAFNHVSLEIPQEDHQVVYSVLFFPASNGDPNLSVQPIRYALDLPRNSSVAALKDCLSMLLGSVPASRIALCEVIDRKIHDLPNDLKPLNNSDACWFAYEVDPFSSEFFHVVASHQLILHDAPDTFEMTTPCRVRIGFPFMTSFPKSFSCRQAWEHIWKCVACVVEPEDSIFLQIAVVDNSQPVTVFPGESSNIPRDVDEPLVSFLGNDATERFLLVILEWRDPGVTEENGKSESRIDEERFVSYLSHSSWIEAVEEKSKSATNDSIGVTLENCFETFTKPERLDEHNMWYCSRCKEHVRAMKTMELWRLPNILIVHLKRFEFKHVLRREKLDTFVHFPMENLDMDVHTANGDANPLLDASVPAVYDLFGVVNHYGRMGFGHYTAFARKWDEAGLSPEWNLFDDSSVRNVGDGCGPMDAVVSPAAYVLFYRRRVFH